MLATVLPYAWYRRGGRQAVGWLPGKYSGKRVKKVNLAMVNRLYVALTQRRSYRPAQQ